MKRFSALALGIALAACSVPGSASVTTSALAASDAATSLAVGDTITEEISTQSPAVEGADPVITLALRHADGRRLSFQQANHTNNDLFVQQPGGALAQIMGLPGEESPQLYIAVSGEGREGAFFCGSQGPAAIGRYQAPDGAIMIVGLRQTIQVEARPDGQLEALPYSPDQVCARLRFRQG